MNKRQHKKWWKKYWKKYFSECTAIDETLLSASEKEGSGLTIEKLKDALRMLELSDADYFRSWRYFNLEGHRFRLKNYGMTRWLIEICDGLIFRNPNDTEMKLVMATFNRVSKTWLNWYTRRVQYA